MTGAVSGDPEAGPACGHPGCEREADYRVAVPRAPDDPGGPYASGGAGPSGGADAPGAAGGACGPVALDLPGGLRCRWHVDALWRPHGAAASVEPLHREAPPIDTSASVRRTLAPAVLLVALALVVLVGFAALAPVLL